MVGGIAPRAMVRASVAASTAPAAPRQCPIIDLIDVTGMCAALSPNTRRTTLEKAFDFATKRYDQGLLSTFELITAQTNFTKAKLDLLTSHYDYVFKMKVLEFYKGQGIKL